MTKLQMCVTVSTEIQRFVWQGQIVARPTPRVLRNDADVLYEILNGMGTEKERFRDRRRTIAYLQKALRPIRKAAQAIEEECEDRVVGEIDVNEEALRFIGKLFDDPPEGIQLPGSTVETALMVEDAIDALKKKDDGPAKEAAPTSKE